MNTHRKTHWQVPGMLLAVLTLLTTLAPNSFAQEAATTLVLRPHCETGYAAVSPPSDSSAPGWAFSVGESCLPYTVRDPQTLATPTMRSGEVLDMDLIIYNPSKKKVSSVRSWLSFDPNVLEGAQLTIDEAFPNITPGEADFNTTDGTVKIHATTDEGSTIEDEVIVVARIQLTVKTAVSPGTVLSFFDVQPGGRTHIQGDVDGQSTYILDVEPGSLFVEMTTEAAAGPVAESSSSSSSSVEQEVNEEASSSSSSSSLSSVSTPDPQPSTELPDQNTGTDPIADLAAQNTDTIDDTVNTALLPNGAACTTNDACSSNICNAGICGPQVATEQPETRVAFPMLQVRNLRATTENETVYLAWDALPVSGLKAYNIYYGSTSGRYIQRKTVPGTTPSVTIRNLPEGTTYYFAVRALNTQDEETQFGQEVSLEVGNPSTSTAPLVASISTDAPKQNPLPQERPMHVPGETGTSTILLLLALLSGAIGTAFAFKRQTSVISY